MNSKLVQTAKKQPVIVACLPGADAEKERTLKEQGIEVLRIPSKNTSLDLQALLQELGKRKIDGILLEGGGTLNESALRFDIVQKVYCYMAPKIFGGAEAKTPVEGKGVELAGDAWNFQRTDIRNFGQDLLIEYKKFSGDEII